MSGPDAWPALPWEAWRETATTLHRWAQIVGKIQLGGVPCVNHWWHVAFHLTPRGLATEVVAHGARTFALEFDLRGHRLRTVDSTGEVFALALAPRSVADLYQELMDALRGVGLDVAIRTNPVEVPDNLPLDQDEVHRSYDPAAAERFFTALCTADRLMRQFRSGFVGKCSPVHFFWGSFDHAVTRFSGRLAPPHPGGIPNLPDRVTREAYSHEVSSCGFWPGSDTHPEPAFYSYAYPSPPGFRDAPVRPAEARWVDALGEFVLPWDAARNAADPDAAVLAFFHSTYAAAADLAGWDRAALERPTG